MQRPQIRERQLTHPARHMTAKQTLIPLKRRRPHPNPHMRKPRTQERTHRHPARQPPTRGTNRLHTQRIASLQKQIQSTLADSRRSMGTEKTVSQFDQATSSSPLAAGGQISSRDPLQLRRCALGREFYRAQPYEGRFARLGARRMPRSMVRLSGRVRILSVVGCSLRAGVTRRRVRGWPVCGWRRFAGRGGIVRGGRGGHERLAARESPAVSSRHCSAAESAGAEKAGPTVRSASTSDVLSTTWRSVSRARTRIYSRAVVASTKTGATMRRGGAFTAIALGFGDLRDSGRGYSFSTACGDEVLGLGCIDLDAADRRLHHPAGLGELCRDTDVPRRRCEDRDAGRLHALAEAGVHRSSRHHPRGRSADGLLEHQREFETVHEGCGRELDRASGVFGKGDLGPVQGTACEARPPGKAGRRPLHRRVASRLEHVDRVRHAVTSSRGAEIFRTPPPAGKVTRVSPALIHLKGVGVTTSDRPALSSTSPPASACSRTAPRSCWRRCCRSTSAGSAKGSPRRL